MCGIRAESTLVRMECYTGKSTHLVDSNYMRTDTDSARIPWIPCGIRAEYMGECKDLNVQYLQEDALSAIPHIMQIMNMHHCKATKVNIPEYT